MGTRDSWERPGSEDSVATYWISEKTYAVSLFSFFKEMAFKRLMQKNEENDYQRIL